MDKETIALIVAQNGLATAATVLLVNAALLEKRIPTAKPADQAKLKKDLAAKKKLAAALKAADTGLSQYMAETGL